MTCDNITVDMTNTTPITANFITGEPGADGSTGGITYHGSLTGLENDDHLQYSLVSGTRGFTGEISGITPTVDAHLATKKYVDDNVVSGGIGITYHGSLTGLEEDDHTQYPLVSGLRGFTGTISGITPVVDAHLSTKKYVDDNTGGSPGGSDTYVQFNDGGSFNGESGLTWDKSLHRLCTNSIEVTNTLKNPSAVSTGIWFENADFMTTSNFFTYDVNTHILNNNGSIAGTTISDGTLSFNSGTFNVFPITPTALPDADYEVANKKYVDDNIGTPAGSDTQIQFNDSGSFGASADLALGASGLELARDFEMLDDKKIYLDTAKTSYFVYNSSESSVELWVNNAIKRRYT